MQNKVSRRTSRVGFTLIELLVVIAIVAVIAAILWPVFSVVRERGRRTVCQSNLKQIALAIQQYVQDNNGTYPLWPNWANAAYAYAKSVQVFHCPDQSDDIHGGPMLISDPASVSGSYPVDYTYDMTWLNVILPPFPTKNILGARESALATPATIWLNVDASWSTPDSDECHNCRAVSLTCGGPFYGSTLHSGGGNYSFIDCHVKWLTPEDAGAVECANGPLPAPFKR